MTLNDLECPIQLNVRTYMSHGLLADTSLASLLYSCKTVKCTISEWAEKDVNSAVKLTRCLSAVAELLVYTAVTVTHIESKEIRPLRAHSSCP